MILICLFLISLKMWLPIEDVHKLLKSIIILRSKVGATIFDIQADYLTLVGERLPILDGDINDAIKFLRKINGVYCVVNEHGKYYWHVVSNNTMHIKNMIVNQKSENFLYERQEHAGNKYKSAQKTWHRNKQTDKTYLYNYQNYDNKVKYQQDRNNKCFFKDNYFYKYNRREVMKPGAYLYKYQLIGDDFFLSIAVSELDCMYTPGSSIRRCGFSKSGLTIREATVLIETAKYIDTNVIINVGSVDILHGRELIDLQTDFEMLIYAFERRGILPIITTIAPLGNICHMPEVCERLQKFNDFLKSKFHFVIDLTECFVNVNGSVIFDCYQPAARHVTGSNQPHLMWNRIGRQRILKLLKRQISYLNVHPLVL